MLKKIMTAMAPSLRHRGPRCHIPTVAVLAAGLPLLSTACSTFENEWRAAAVEPTPRTEIVGRWAGTWSCEIRGHTGDLRCIVTRQDAEHIRARFHAKYAAILTAEYSVIFLTEQRGDAWRIRGQQDLGWLAGGVYTYDGTVTPAEFLVNYDSKGYRGSFKMNRPN